MYGMRRAASAVFVSLIVSLPLTPLLPLAAHANPQADDTPLLTMSGTVLRPKPVFALPVHGYRLTGRFGDVSGLWRTVHTGLDFAAPTGTAIHAVAGGVVTSTGYDGSYGNKTVITLVDGTELWYCHQTSILVSPGTRISVGQEIGTIGSTGNVTGPHLHLEVRPNPSTPIDPMGWLIGHGLRP